MVIELFQIIIQREVRRHAALFRYRKMQHHLRNRYKFNIPRGNAMNIITEIYPEGTEIR